MTPSTDQAKEAFARAFGEIFGKAATIDRALPPPRPPAAPAPAETESPEARAERIWRITQAMAR